MADTFSKVRRSELMASIRSRGNKGTEIALLKLMRRNSIVGWRRNHNLFGKPDFIFLKVRLAVFVDGCFWHGCPKHATQPVSNRAFWKKKLARNRARDQIVNRALRRLDWKVIRIWQHELARKNETRLLKRIHRALKRDEY